jgi:ferredoxin
MLALLTVVLLVVAVSRSAAFFLGRSARATSQLQMGFMDVMNKALANDPNMQPQQNAGLSSKRQEVEVEFFPSGKKVKAIVGQDLPTIAKAAKVEIKYKCKKGDCGTCKVNFEGTIVKACQSSLPIATKKTKFTIGIIPSK